MTNFLKNIKTSAIGIITIIISALVSFGKIPAETGTILIGTATGVGHILGADASTVNPLVNTIQDNLPQIVSTIQTVADNHAAVSDKIDATAKAVTDLTNAISANKQ